MNQARKPTNLIAFATLLLIVLVIVAARQFFTNSLHRFSEPRLAPLVPSSPPAPTLTNEFDLATTKVGDTVAGLTVAEIKPYFEGWPSDPDNVSIRFSGALRLDGYSYELSGTACFEVADDESRRGVPHMRGDGRAVNFCFRNSEFAHSSLQPLDTGERMTIVIDNYTINSYPNGASVNEADLVTLSPKRESKKGLSEDSM